jgi:hypothetical protein
LRKIADALAEDARSWGALIDGPGGIGKTALAIRAAESVPSGRFRRIIFLSLKEHELTADGQRALGYFVVPTYLEMLIAIARELGQADTPKSPETERLELILRALRDARRSRSHCGRSSGQGLLRTALGGLGLQTGGDPRPLPGACGALRHLPRWARTSTR